MRKMILMATMGAISALMLTAAPALAQNQGGGPDARTAFCQIPPGNPENARIIIIGDPAPGGNIPGFVVDENVTREEARDLRGEPCGPGVDGNGPNNGGNNNGGNNNNNGNVVPVFEIAQDFEQEAESGDVDQNFDVSQTGDNSNQTVGIQGVANTGNAQNQIGVVDAGHGFGGFDANDERFFFVDDEDGFFGDDLNNDRFFGDNDGDFEFEDVGSTIEVSPTNTTSRDQQVNQTATSFGK